jgi:dTDP-4-amino-4,6-dideoxygalactose transaminase
MKPTSMPATTAPDAIAAESFSVADCRTMDLTKITDARGNLTFIEAQRHVPFDIKRVYYLYDVPAGSSRAGHAHKDLFQLLIPISGSFDIHLDDGFEKRSVHMNRPYTGLLVTPMIWRVIDNFSSGCVCVVLCSAPYDEADYYREYDGFLAEAKASRSTMAISSVKKTPCPPASSQPVTVPFLDLKHIHKEISGELINAFASVLHDGGYILGQAVEQFERSFAAYQQTKYCIGVGNGLDAITLTLRALGVGQGDDVLVPSNTFIATWLAVDHVGARCVPVEPDPQTHLITAQTVRNALTPKTKAVIPVHLYGQLVAMEEIQKLCKEKGLFLIEDAAQAHGAERNGRRAGTFGNAATFSFYPGKNLGGLGDGGAITTDDDKLAATLRSLRNYGSSQKYIHDEMGYNSRLDTVQAAILQSKLPYLDKWNERRQQIAEIYLRELAAAPGLILPQVMKDNKPVWHLFVVRHAQREQVRMKLEAAGVQTLIHYPVPPHLQKAYASQAKSFGPLPISEQLGQEVFSLPMGPHLSDEQALYTAQQLTKICRELKTSPTGN